MDGRTDVFNTKNDGLGLVVYTHPPTNADHWGLSSIYIRTEALYDVQKAFLLATNTCSLIVFLNRKSVDCCQSRLQHTLVHEFFLALYSNLTQLEGLLCNN